MGDYLKINIKYRCPGYEKYSAEAGPKSEVLETTTTDAPATTSTSTIKPITTIPTIMPMFKPIISNKAMTTNAASVKKGNGNSGAAKKA
jgi:hypothetical protein